MTEGEGDGLWPEALTKHHHSSSGTHTPITGADQRMGSQQGAVWVPVVLCYYLASADCPPGPGHV